jgi:hypothetical protein
VMHDREWWDVSRKEPHQRVGERPVDTPHEAWSLHARKRIG